MRSKPSRLALMGIALVSTAILVACNCAPRLQFLTVAPTNAEIYESTSGGGAVLGAARHGLRPSLKTPWPTGRRAEAVSAATATCGSLQYAATALFSDGSTKDESSTATWSSSNTSVAQISATGLATPIGPGTTNIGATFSGVSASSETLAVDQLNSITVGPSSASVPKGTSQPFSAIGNFTFGAGGSGDLDVSSQVTWNSSNTDVATIDSTGNASTVGTGTTNITAFSCDGLVSNTATLTVTPAVATSLVVTPASITISTGTTTLFTAMEKLSDGTIQAVPPGTVVNWSSDATTVATVDPSSGVALGITAGGANITASAAGLNSGSGALTVQAAAARFAYVADAQGGTGSSGTISGYAVDAAAATLAPFASPVAASSPQQVLLHPSGDLMYYIDSNGSLHVDDVKSADGSFSESGQAPTPASTSNNSFNVGVIDPTGRYIYVISGNDNTIYGFSIAQTADKAPATNGALTPIPSFNPYTDANLNSPTWIMTDRKGKYVYVVNNGANTISQYSIGPNGALSPLPTPTIPTGTSPFFGTTDVNGHLYVANETPQSVSGYSIDTTNGSTAGQLTQIGLGPVPINNAAFTINVITDPTGKFLYVLDSTISASPPSQVFAFNLNPATGVIGSQIGTPQLAGNSPTGMAIDPTGVFMAIDNNFDNTLSLFTVSILTGAVTPATPPTAPTDTQPLFVVFYTAASGQ